MKKSISEIVFLAHFSLASLGFAGMVSAHDQAGALGMDGSAVDVYQVTCSTDSGGVSDHLEVQVFDPTTTPGGGKISAVVRRNSVVLNSSDSVRADTERSPVLSMSGGDGNYDVMVHKLKTGLKS